MNVIPNPWDIGSARYLQRLGCPALGDDQIRVCGSRASAT